MDKSMAKMNRKGPRLFLILFLILDILMRKVRMLSYETGCGKLLIQALACGHKRIISARQKEKGKHKMWQRYGLTLSLFSVGMSYYVWRKQR